MPARPALSRVAIGWVSAVGLAACTQPGTQAPLSEAKKLNEATTAISVSCGYAEQTAAFGGPHAAGLAGLDASAAAGARKLAAVYARVPTDVYQGETVQQIVSDSSQLLGECGLAGAQRALSAATSKGR